MFPEALQLSYAPANALLEQALNRVGAVGDDGGGAMVTPAGSVDVAFAEGQLNIHEHQWLDLHPERRKWSLEVLRLS